MSNNEIAWQIFEALQKAGAGIGNASVPIIERVLDEAAQHHVHLTGLNVHENQSVLRVHPAGNANR